MKQQRRDVVISHPEEQGLKLKKIGNLDMASLVVISHPEEQGLKPQKLKKQTLFLLVVISHPEEQGLKPQESKHIHSGVIVVISHPEEQGLKLGKDKISVFRFFGRDFSSRRTRIETRRPSTIYDEADLS